MMGEFHPFRRTTTITFHDCRHEYPLISPKDPREMYLLARSFVDRLIISGFNVTERENFDFADRLRIFWWKLQRLFSGGFLPNQMLDILRYDVVFRRFFDPNKKFGYTMGAILSGSDASVHTYPEDEFGRTYELELNLCFLWPEMQIQHERAIQHAIASFRLWLQPGKEPEVEHSRVRYFDPVSPSADTLNELAQAIAAS